MQSPGRQCEHVKPDGQRCRANALPGSSLCYFHDPAKAADRDRNRRSGGKAATRRVAVLDCDAPDLPLASAKDVTAALGTITNLVLRGRLDPKVSNAAAYLLSTLVRSLEVGDLAERMAEVERRLPPRKGTP